MLQLFIDCAYEFMFVKGITIVLLIVSVVWMWLAGKEICSILWYGLGEMF